MKRVLIAFGVAATLIAVIGMAVSLIAPDAIAQIRAALVKNVDEPYRTPYEVWAEFSQFGCGSNCSNFTSVGPLLLFDLPAVPAGKRLVVTHVSGSLPSSTSSSLQIGFQETRVLAFQFVKWGYFGFFFSIGSNALQGFSSPARFSVEGGQQPHVHMILPSANNFIGNVVVSGYLIDATN